MSILTPTSDANFAADTAKGITLVDFWAEWCGPCRMMLPRLEELQTRLGEKARILKMNVDENQQVASSFRIMSIPTMILFKDGTMCGAPMVGVQDINALEKKILEYVD